MTDSKPTRALETAPLWQLAFRAGFLLAATFGVVAMGRWLYWLLWPGSWHGSVSPHWWHAHEMVFGFAMPVVAGFLLTAVATWTSLPGTRGARLQVLFGLWLAARLGLWLYPEFSLLAWLAESAFILLLSAELGWRVWQRRQWRNILFLPVLLALLALNGASYWYADDPLAGTRLHYGAVWLISALVVIVGGRVIPLFTGNRLGIKVSPLPVWVDHLAIGSVVVVGLVSALWPARESTPWFEWLCLASAALHLYRLAHWQGWKTLAEPLLWSMHLSYLCIPLALAGLAAVGSDPVASKNVIHLLAVGTVGGMILAMMSRVSLGHTGRPLAVPGYLAVAFALVLLAAVIRAFVPLFDASLTQLAWRSSAALWIAAFGLFLLHFLPVLTRPRVDGKPG